MYRALGGASRIGQESGGWEPGCQHLDRKQDGIKDGVWSVGHKGTLERTEELKLSMWKKGSSSGGQLLRGSDCRN